MKPLLLAAAWLLLSGAQSAAHAEAGDCPPGDAVLEQHLAGLQTLSANFEQRVTAADGHSLQQSSGILQLARPGRIYWVAEPPFEQTVVSDGQRIWVYDPDLEQVTVRPLASQLDNSPAALLVGDADQVLEEFRICAFREGDVTRIQLHPLNTDALYTEIELLFEAGAPAGIRMIDSLGQHTQTTLSTIELNQPLDPQVFHFTPPPGVDVFRDE